MLGFQGGYQTTFTRTPVTPCTFPALDLNSRGSDWAAGQCGDVRVIVTGTTPSAPAFTS